MKSKIYIALVGCCLSFLFASCETEFGQGGTGGGGGMDNPKTIHKSNTIQQPQVETDATDTSETK